MHFGGIIVPPGYTDPCKFVDGNPYGASLVTTHDNIDEFDEATNNALDHLARRVVSFADRLTSSLLATLNLRARHAGKGRSH